jgi:hypothetical protein
MYFAVINQILDLAGGELIQFLLLLYLCIINIFYLQFY